MYADNKCQLSGSGRFTGLSNSTEDPQVLYRGIKVGNLPQFSTLLLNSKWYYVWLKERCRCLYIVFGTGKEIQF